MNMKDFPEFEIFQDFNGTQIKFQYALLDTGTFFSLKAIEDSKKDLIRIFSSYDNVSLANTLEKIRKTIKEELNRRYFTESDNDKFNEMNFDYFRGNISENSDSQTCLIVDGKEMSMNDFEKLISPYNGFRIEVKIFEE